MTDHIAVGEVYSEILILAGFDALDELICNLSALHPRTLLKGNYIRGNLDVCLKLLGELAGLVSVPEVCYVTVLLCLRDSKLIYTCICEIFAHSVSDLGRRYKVLRGDVKISVVLKHTRIDNLGNSYTVEFVECALGSFECLGDLNGSVAAEIVEYYAVAVRNSAYCFAVLCNYKGRKILVDNLKLLAVCEYCLGSGCKLSALTENVCLPAALYHRPVSLVTVHSDLHSSTAGCDTNIEICISEISDKCLKGLNIVKCTCLTNVASVDKHVDSHLVYFFSLSLKYHSLEVIDVRVYVSVGEKTEEMKCGIVAIYVRDELFPSGRSKHLTGLDGLRYKLSALSENLTCAECVVTYLRVTHVVVRGKTNCRSVSLEANGGILLHKHIKCGSICSVNSICFGLGSDSNSVHNDSEYRTLYSFEINILFKCGAHNKCLRDF